MRLPIVFTLFLVSLFTLVSCGGTGNADYFALQIEGTSEKDYNESSMQNVLQTLDGGMIAVGRFNSQLWVMKFDRDGGVTWQNTYNEAFFFDKGLYLLDDGAYAITGTKRGDAFFLVLETNGEVRSLQYYKDFYYADSQQTDGGFYLMGGVADGSALLKLDNSGNIIHSSFYNTLTNLTAVVELPSGAMVLAGERGNLFSDEGRIDLVLLKTDSLGELIDTAVYGNDTTGFFVAGLYLNENQQIVLGGYTQYGTFANPDNFDHPIKLVINQDLSIASAQQYTFNKTASIADLIHTADGGMLMAGQFGQTNSDLNQSHSALVKTDRNGAIEWAKRYEFRFSTDNSDARSIVESNRGYLMSGSFMQDGYCGYVISTNFDGVIEDSGFDINNVTNGILNNFTLASYSDQNIFWQSYVQASVSESTSASPSTSVVTRR